MQKENENFINFQLNDTNYYNDYKKLEEMGIDKLMIKKVYEYINPKSIDDSIEFIYQHECIEDEIKINKCYFCEKEIKDHINFEGLIDKDKLDIKINDEKYKILKEKGEKATCRIITKDEEGNGINGSGFFCKILYLNKTIKVLFTNNHILNEESIQIGKKIKLVYKGLRKELEITENRFCKTSPLNDFTCIQILEEDKIEDFFEIGDYNNNNYENEDISIIHYPKGGEMKIDSGHFIQIKKNMIYHNVNTEKGSSGSPIILLLSENFPIIGIHEGGYNEESNVGIYIKDIIECI